MDEVSCHLPYWEASSVLMLGSHPRCWARLAGVLDGKNIYSGSTMLIKIYPTLSAAIGGRDRVDGRRCSWMTPHSHLPYWETSPDLVLGCPLCWAQLAAVLDGVKLYYGSSILIKNYPTLSAAIGGWDGVDA